jgi:threonine dehydrogenase-like Zn-dependent dehydrogenase
MYHSVSCGHCDNCLAGNDYMCRRASALSLGLGVVPGGYAETVAAPTATLFAVAEHVSDDDAALAEPFAIALHGVNKAAIAPDTPTVVLGAGPIGAMTAVALRLRGHDNIVVVEPNVNRQEHMRQLGFRSFGLDDVVSTVTKALGGAPGAVLECSGGARAAGLAVDLVGYQGRIMLQGMPSKRVELSQSAILVKEVELVGAVSCTTAEFGEALDLLAAGSIPAASLITDTIELADVNRMFDELLTPGNAQLKVLVAPAG